jgi:nucleotide-binding universal stress UspA family protein
MFINVVVGVDGRQGGRDAIALARQLVADTGELTLAHVYEYDGDPSIRGYDEHDAEKIDRARELLEAERREAEIDAHLCWTGFGAVGGGLHNVAEMVSADLLVIGSTRRGLLGRVLIGDDTRAALNGAPCAVAIAPAGYASHPAPIRKVGVGYDGSAESRRALGTGRTLAAGLGASLAALEVVWFPAYLFEGPVAGDSDTIEDLISDAHARVAAAGDLEPNSSYGQPAEELAQWSASLDLLVVGSRGYGPTGRLVHGSTSFELARRARCPLLVLTRAPRETIKLKPDEELAGHGTVAPSPT